MLKNRGIYGIFSDEVLNGMRERVRGDCPDSLGDLGCGEKNVKMLT